VLERAVPKNRGTEFVNLIEDLANDTCVDGEPQCQRCELRKICAFALSRKHGAPESASAGKARSSKNPVKKPAAKKAGSAAPLPSAPKTNKPAKTGRATPEPTKPARGKHADK
jgi:endonuclease-3